MKRIRIEEVGDINCTYNYLEVFFSHDKNPFLDVSITDKRELSFKYYPSKIDIVLNEEEWNYILSTARTFLPKALKNADYIQFHLLRTTSTDPDFRQLITQLDTELREMYADLMDTYDQHNIIEQTDTVLIAYLNNEPVGCGCFKPFDTETVELKRMFVSKKARGKGISKLMLTELETWARELGFKYTVLETGSKNIEAQYLYRKSGYLDIPSYGPYVDLPDSVCMGKSLV